MENETEIMEISDEELNRSISSTIVSESVDSNGDLNSSQNISQNETKNSIKNSTKKRKLTKTEREFLKAERDRIKAQKEKQMKEEKERKAQELQQKKELLEKERIEKQKIKDAEKEKRDKEKREKEAEKQRIKDEKEKERLEKQQLKEMEKLKKQEERDAQSEKRRKLEEEKQRKQNEKQKASEEQNRKLEKSREVLNRFFKKGSDDTNRPKNVLTDMKSNTNGLFLPFQLSANQTLAPIVHNSVKERFVLGAFDASIKGQDLNRNELYIESLKNSNHKPFKYTKQQSSQPEIIIEDDFDNNGNERKFYKIKHLQFHLNVRPPYRGTWTKKSRVLSGRKPFNKDLQFFDYEVDSDEEWEEGGPGESLDGSDSDGSLKDDYEIDNEFFVPHGYLSPDENDEIEQQLIQNNNNNDNNVHMIDTQSEGKEPKCGPLLKEQVLMAERNKSFSKTLIPVVIGCVWESNTDQNNQKFVESLQHFKRISLKHK